MKSKHPGVLWLLVEACSFELLKSDKIKLFYELNVKCTIDTIYLIYKVANHTLGSVTSK